MVNRLKTFDIDEAILQNSSQDPDQPSQEPTPAASSGMDNVMNWENVLAESPENTDESECNNSTVDERDAINRQISSYLKEPRTPRGDDALKYCQKNSDKYPLFVSAARKYIGIPALSAASEREF